MLHILVESAVALGLTSSQELPILREPTLPNISRQSFELGCGSETLRVSGYGVWRPGRAAGPVIMSGGRALEGRMAEAMRRDLSNPRAAYRLTGQCLPENGGIWFRIYSGENADPGAGASERIEFRAASAIIRNGRIERYSGLQPADEGTFWFR